MADDTGRDSQDPPGEGNGDHAAGAVLAKLSWAMRTVGGPARHHNEDWVGAYVPSTPDDAWDRGPLLVVCDGMGGHAAGEVASRVAVDAALTSWSAGAPAPAAAAVRTAVRRASTAVIDAASDGRGRQGMGSTIVALSLGGREAVVGHVGDSRAYRVRDGEVEQLTADHSQVGEMLRRKLITPEQAAVHPHRSVLTRSLGAGLVANPDLTSVGIRKEDAFVLCTDGMWDVVGRADLAEVCSGLGGPWPTPRDAVGELVDRALKRGSADNVSCAIVVVTSERPIPSAPARRAGRLWRRS